MFLLILLLNLQVWVLLFKQLSLKSQLKYNNFLEKPFVLLNLYQDIEFLSVYQILELKMKWNEIIIS